MPSESQPNEPPTHLTPSALGNKSYWSDIYKRDLANHESTPDEIGAVWFDDSDAESKVLSYLISLAEDQGTNSRSTGEIDKDKTTFLDLGTGNGHMLFELREGGFSGPMVGVDYATESVELARRIASEEDVEDTDLRFECWDIMASGSSSDRNNGLPEWVPRCAEATRGSGFDVLLDKGTFDAISLSEETDAAGRRICEAYPEKVKRLMRRDGLLIVTSCNWTEQELIRWFEKDEEEESGHLVTHGRIPYRQFGFGGQVGQTVSSVVFRKEGG
ncbi:MAG: hypothetical protein M4579_003097 [Chaenotheca gracillima]|nr:MAG: hypothetical protein M4579_003097 [Chaenotheca gracillima]